MTSPIPPEELIRRIRAALQTEEEGEALIEVAAAACRAEMELAALLRKQEESR